MKRLSLGTLGQRPRILRCVDPHGPRPAFGGPLIRNSARVLAPAGVHRKVFPGGELKAPTKMQGRLWSLSTFGPRPANKDGWPPTFSQPSDTSPTSVRDWRELVPYPQSSQKIFNGSIDTLSIVRGNEFEPLTPNP